MAFINGYAITFAKQHYNDLIVEDIVFERENYFSFQVGKSQTVVILHLHFLLLIHIHLVEIGNLTVRWQGSHLNTINYLHNVKFQGDIAKKISFTPFLFKSQISHCPQYLQSFMVPVQILHFFLFICLKQTNFSFISLLPIQFSFFSSVSLFLDSLNFFSLHVVDLT